MARETSPIESEEETNSQEHQACYVFTPTNIEEATARSVKRRRTSNGKHEDSNLRSEQTECLFTPLLNDLESKEAVHTRWNTYHRLWSEQENRTKAILDSFNEKTLGDVSNFVETVYLGQYDGKIPTALVLAGPNIASHGPLFKQFATRIRDEDKQGPVVLLTSKDAVNLKGALKKVIRDSTLQGNACDYEDEELIVGRRGAKLLNYDLQILHNWCKLHEGKKVIVAVQDTEAFDTGILTDLVGLFSAYLDRIPFVLLLGIATSLDIFHEKLPKATIRLMKGQKFDVERTEECLAQIFNDAVTSGQAILRLGRDVTTLIMMRQKDHTQSIQSFVAALKYVYMSHFYANPLSIILAYVDNEEGLRAALTDKHIEAIRNLPSFRRLVEEKLRANLTTEVRAHMRDNDNIRKLVWQSMQQCRDYAIQLSQGLEVFELARSCQTSSSITRKVRYELYPQALAGDLHVESPPARELLLAIKKMNSESLLKLLDAVLTRTHIPELVKHLAPIKSEVQALIEDTGDGDTNLTSEFNIAANALRTTAVSKKIQINKHKSGLTKNDTAYSKLVQRMHDVLEAYFSKTLNGLAGLFLQELFFYDMPSPHRDIFAPKARGAVERALSKPIDYLACECCALNDDEGEQGEENVLKPTNPPSSIVYQLLQESGALINSFDLWSAFKSVLEGGEDDEEEGQNKSVDELTAQALFFRSIAEMKFLGFVKQTRKGVDHLQKIAWKGL